MAKQFDVFVIGGGPGGYVAAIRAAQLGFSTACAESNAYADPKSEPRFGGTCLNVGCVPSKALLHTSHMYHLAHEDFAGQGIIIKGDVSIDVKKMLERKDKVVDQLTSGVKFLFKKNKVTPINGHASFVGKSGEFWQVSVGGEIYEAKNIIVATGSTARHLADAPVDNKLICDNIGALDFSDVPKRLCLIGSGVIGLEMGSVWSRLGAEVTVLEAMDSFLAAADADLAKEAQKIFTKQQGLDIKLSIKVGKIQSAKNGKSVKISYSNKDGSNEQTEEFDKLIVSIGRLPNTAGLAAEAVGLAIDERGFITVDAQCKTNLPGVWAVGDVVRGPMLAHKAMEEGVMVAEVLAGQAGEAHFDHIPWVIYTSPEIAWVGKTEAQLKAEGVDYRAGKIPFLANGRALGQGETAGFVKMLADAKTDRILGVHIIGANASELIAEAVVTMEFSGASEDLARIVHAHPTLSEAVHEAALAVAKRSIHF